MRLSKRIAAVALAAVMAVSMLTACGGGGGGSNGGSSSSGSNNGSSSSSSSSSGASSGSSSGSSSSSSSGSGSSSSTGGGTGSETKPSATTMKNSRTGALMQKALASGQIQLVVVEDEYDETLQDYPQFTMARSGKNVCVQVASKDGTKKYLEEIKNGTDQKEYFVLYPDCSMYKGMKKELEDKGYNTEKLTMPIYEEEKYDPNNSDLPIEWNDYEENAKVELGTYTYKKNGAIYHSETVTDKNGQSIYCYDNSGSLKLLVECTVDKNTGKVEEHISEVKSIAFTVNPAVFKVNKDAIDYREINNYITKK